MSEYSSILLSDQMHQPTSIDMQRLERAQYTKVSANQLQQADKFAQFQLTNTGNLNPPFSSVEQLKGEDNIAKINPEQIKSLYDEIKTLAKDRLDASNQDPQTLTEFDYLKTSIEEIEGHKIDVKIEPEEIKTAILYSSLGINFLDIKRLETRIEVYQLAKQEVAASAKNQGIRQDQAEQLTQFIDQKIAHLQSQKRSLLERDGVKINEDELFQKVKLNKAVNAFTEAK